MWLNVLMLVFGHLVLPVFFLTRTLRHNYAGQLDWILTEVMVASFFAFLFVIGRWDWFGYSTRFLLPAAFCLALPFSYGAVRDLPLLAEGGGGSWIDSGINALLVAVFAAFAVKALSGYRRPAGAVEVAFPLRDGTFYIAHGGNDVRINYHHAHRTQKHALDVVKLNRVGARASGLYPKRLPRYAIFDEPVYSPVAGTVLQAVDGLLDLTPPERDPQNRAGNHVVVKPAGLDVYILLAHLRNGSVSVSEGDTVKQGQLVGRVGNSGNTTEPHLHIHCATIEGADFVGSGDGVPLVFAGRYLRRNSLMRT